VGRVARACTRAQGLRGMDEPKSEKVCRRWTSRSGTWDAPGIVRRKHHRESREVRRRQRRVMIRSGATPGLTTQVGWLSRRAHLRGQLAAGLQDVAATALRDTGAGVGVGAVGAARTRDREVARAPRSAAAADGRRWAGEDGVAAVFIGIAVRLFVAVAYVLGAVAGGEREGVAPIGCRITVRREAALIARATRRGAAADIPGARRRQETSVPRGVGFAAAAASATTTIAPGRRERLPPARERERQTRDRERDVPKHVPGGYIFDASGEGRFSRQETHTPPRSPDGVCRTATWTATRGSGEGLPS